MMFALTLVGLASGLVHHTHMFVVLQPTVILAWCRMLKFLMLFESVGVLIIMIMEMFKDIALWGLVSTVFTVAFSVAFVANANAPWLEVSKMPLWAMLGSYEVDEVAKWGEVGSLFSESMLWLYVVVSNIVLVNLLIAMMGDTYGKIKENADAEFKIGRLRSVLGAWKQMHPVPPPLNLPITLYYFVKSRGRPLKTERDAGGAWDPGGRLWTEKRDKDFVAGRLLQKMNKKVAEEAQTGDQMKRLGEKIKGIETTLQSMQGVLARIDAPERNWHIEEVVYAPLAS